jgi:hypothetical protein
MTRDYYALALKTTVVVTDYYNDDAADGGGGDKSYKTDILETVQLQ